MKLESIACNNCGAPLELPPQAKFVKCRHCEAQLAVKHNNSVTFTEQIQGLNETTDRLQDQVDQLSYDNALIRLDREWDFERKSYMMRNKHGSEYEPSMANAVAVAVIGGVMSIFALANLGGFGLIVLVFTVVGAGLAYSKSMKYSAAQRRYERRRADLARKYRPADRRDEDGL